MTSNILDASDLDPGDGDSFESEPIIPESEMMDSDIEMLPSTEEFIRNALKDNTDKNNNDHISLTRRKRLASSDNESVSGSEVIPASSKKIKKSKRSNINLNGPGHLDKITNISEQGNFGTVAGDISDINPFSVVTASKSNQRRDRTPNFPTNNSLSSKSGSTILINPEGDDANTFCYSPIAISRGLKENPFNKIIPKDTRINKSRNLLAIELYDSDIQYIPTLLKATKLGKFNIKCSLPMNENICSGVIGPIENDIPIEDLELMVKCHEAEIAKITRLPKFVKSNEDDQRMRKQPSMTIKIDFKTTTLPNKVYIESMAFSVRKYNFPPLRCYKCQKFGHMASGCKRKDYTCNLCSGKHAMKDCTNTSYKCVNCGESHAASSKLCKLNKEAKEIERLRNQGSSFSAARQTVIANKKQSEMVNPKRQQLRHHQILTDRGIGSPSTENHNLNTIEVPVDVHQTQGSYLGDLNQGQSRSYSDAVTPRNINKNNEKIDEQINTMKGYIDEAISRMTIKLATFLHEVFSLQLQKEHSRERGLLLTNLAKHHFGHNINSELFNNHLNFSIPPDDDSEEASQVIKTKSVNNTKTNKKTEFKQTGPKALNLRGTGTRKSHDGVKPATPKKGPSQKTQ